MDEHRFQDSDLYKIVLGATLNVNPFKNLNAGEIRRLCIENHERLEKIKDLFSTGTATEASEVLGHLKSQIEQAEKPWCWMLDHDPQAVVRAFTLSAIMHQHGLEYDVLLANFDVGLERFKAIPKKSIEYTIKDMLKADPDQIAEDVAAVEGFLKEEPEKRLAFLLADRCKLDHPDDARKVLLTEKLSSLVRSMALLSLLIDLLTNRKKEYHKAILRRPGRRRDQGQGRHALHCRPPSDAAMGHVAGDVPANDSVLRDRRQAEGPGPQAQGAEARPASVRPVPSTLERRRRRIGSTTT